MKIKSKHFGLFENSMSIADSVPPKNGVPPSPRQQSLSPTKRDGQSGKILLICG